MDEQRRQNGMKPCDGRGGGSKDTCDEPRNCKDGHPTPEARRGEEGLILLGWIFGCWATSTGAVFWNLPDQTGWVEGWGLYGGGHRRERRRQERQGDGTGRKNCSRQDWCAQELPCWAFVFVSLRLWASVSLSCCDLSCHLTKVHSHCKPNTQILPSVLTTEPTPSPPEDWRRVLPLSPSNAAFLPRLALAKCFPGGTVILPPAITVGFQSFMNNSSFQNVLISTFSISSE